VLSTRQQRQQETGYASHRMVRTTAPLATVRRDAEMRTSDDARKNVVTSWICAGSVKMVTAANRVGNTPPMTPPHCASRRESSRSQGVCRCRPAAGDGGDQERNDTAAKSRTKHDNAGGHGRKLCSRPWTPSQITDADETPRRIGRDAVRGCDEQPNDEQRRPQPAAADV